MKGFSFFGRPRRRRLAMTFGYECRPSLWRTLRSNSHLVIAAFGTASFLAVAAIALWFALPSVDRPAFAETIQEPVAQATASPSAAATPADAQSVIVAQPPPVEASAVAGETGAAPSDLRWKDPNAAKSPPQTADAAAKAAQAVNAEAGSAEPAVASNPQLAAFAAANRAEVNGGDADTGSTADVAQTAAVPTPKPATPEKQVAKAETDAPQPASTGDGATTPGHTVHGVTMRSGPQKGASAIDTIPAKTAVQIVACKRWCEILYDGKRGWVYKTFVARD